MAVNKILFVTLSNIGDVILTLPSLDYVRAAFPGAEITVIVGPRPAQIFVNNPAIKRLVVYDKQAPRKEKKALLCALKKEGFDLIIDLRNSIFGWLLPAQFKTSCWMPVPAGITHMKDRHLYKTHNTLRRMRYEVTGAPGKSLSIPQEDAAYVEAFLKGHSIKAGDAIVVIAPGARSHTKRWSQDKFVSLIQALKKEYGAAVVLVGDHDDVFIAQAIEKKAQGTCINLAGSTTLTQLAALLQRAALLITNDSAVLHLGSYLDMPCVAIFGISNEAKYGPWGKVASVAKKDIVCRPCEKAQCRFGTLECMSLINVEDVLRQARKVMAPASLLQTSRPEQAFKRILIVRTDRIGDVLLSTPVIKALRDAYPHAFIAMIVGPYAKEIVEGNPYLDQVIIYDKDGKHKGWQRSMKFARNLKKKRFDAAFVLHPTNRVHLVTFFAGIKKRIGFDRKLGALLTDRIVHAKQEGEKHELQYNLDLLRYEGIEPADTALFMPIRHESEAWAKELFSLAGITAEDKVMGIHPGASCPSKLWPAARFAEVADGVITRYNYKVVIVAGPKDMECARVVAKGAHYPVVNLAGKTSVSQLASVLKRCRVFISNDSGPVHIATAVGTPVISIFGRNQKGLSPERWKPVGLNDLVIHKEVGCGECAAHNCVKGFLCLKAITAQDVLEAVGRVLGRSSERGGPS